MYIRSDFLDQEYKLRKRHLGDYQTPSKFPHEIFTYDKYSVLQ